MVLEQWARRWGVPAEALADLRGLMGAAYSTDSAAANPGSEAAVQAQVRLDASKLGGRLFRNNVGAGRIEGGAFMRWGLANETAAMNKAVKSADLIGVKPVLIEQSHVGTVIGQFWSVEVKRPGWRWAGDAHELAQLRWAELVVSLGGCAYFTNGELK